MSKYYFLLFIVLIPILIYSQEKKSVDKTDYSYLENLEYNNNLPNLVTALTKDCENELEKAEIIFRWIANNISYDYKKFNKNKRIKTFKYKDKVDCKQKVIRWKNKNLEEILKKKKAICSGYSDLYMKMCNIAGIDCIVIDGYIKNSTSHIGRLGILDHSWNAIIIDNEYHYLDVTWASGYCTSDQKGKLNSFVKQFNDYYWLTPIDKLSRDHFPKDTLKLVNSNYNKKLFKQNPFIKSSILPKIELISPTNGLINSKVGDTIIFSFRYTDNINRIEINTNIKKNVRKEKSHQTNKTFDLKEKEIQKDIIFEKQNDVYSFKYTIENKNLKFIEILFDHSLALKYLTKIE